MMPFSLCNIGIVFFQFRLYVVYLVADRVARKVELLADLIIVVTLYVFHVKQ